MQDKLKIKIDYEKDRRNPSEVFLAMACYIDAHQEISQVLIESLGINEHFTIKLDDIETGSIASVISSVPGRIAAWVENALFSSSLELAKDIAATDSTSTEDEVNAIAQRLETELEKHSPPQISSPHIDRKQLAHALCKLSEANKKLHPEEKAYTSIVGKNNVTQINTHWRFNADPKEMFLGKVTKHDTTDKIYVKAPVNIGKGVWQFVSVLTHRSYSAKIRHESWLERYQSGEIPAIGPRDLMEAEVSYEIYTPPPGKGKPQIRSATINKVKAIHRNIGLQHEIDSLD